jgi:magnesium-transporting ATPase (P-type)
MTVLEKNRFIGVAFLVVAFYHLAILSLGLFGFSLAYPYITKTSETVSSKITENDSQDPARFEITPNGIPGYPGLAAPKSSGLPTPQPTPMSKAAIEAQRTMTMIYIVTGIQLAVLLFILFAGFTVVSVRAGGRSLGIVASIFMLFFYPLGTVVSIVAIWFLIGDECLELYSEVEKDKRSPQSII